MGPLWPRSILVQTALTVLISVVLAGAAFLRLSAPVLKERVTQAAEVRLEELLDTIESGASIACFTRDKGLAAELAAGLMKNREVASVVIRGDAEELSRLPAGSGQKTVPALQLRRTVVSPFDRSQTVGEIVLEANGLDMDRQASETMEFFVSLLGGQATLLGLLVTGIVLLLIVRPMKHLSDGLHRMDAMAGERLTIPAVHGKDEIGRLASDINGLADRLVAAVEKEHLARLKIEESERKYRAIFDHAEAGIFMTRADGSIDSCNGAFLMLTCIAPGAIGDCPRLADLPWREPEVVRRTLAECRGDFPVATGDFEIVTPHGESRWLHFTLSAVGPEQIQGIITDVTELSRAHQAAESASRTKTAFLASMSHELRTPLNAIIGFAQMLDMGVPGALSHSQKEAVRYILGSGRHLLILINEVLDLARIEAGRLDLSIRAVVIYPQLEQVATLVAPATEDRRVSIQLPSADALRGLCVRADPDRLRQVLLNLLTNAIKYNREGGVVRVACTRRGNAMRISISDTGAGIAKERQSLLFQPFQRLGAEQSSIEGTGIGLVICKQLTEAMNGSIGFESETGTGSRFWIDLPTDEDPGSFELVDDAPAIVPVEDDLAVRGRVLYVEDNPVNVEVMRHAFRLLPSVELYAAIDAESGLSLVREIRPDLVLMDINLPGLNGIDALKILRADPVTATIPVVAVSAAASVQDRTDGLACGFLSYLTKPFEVPELIALVKHTLAMRSTEKSV